MTCLGELLPPCLVSTSLCKSGTEVREEEGGGDSFATDVSVTDLSHFSAHVQCMFFVLILLRETPIIR